MDDFLIELPDGTVKQRNPFTGTEVWTAPGRGNRPIGVVHPDATPLEPRDFTHACAFCSARYLDTPPEKERLVLDAGEWVDLQELQAEDLFATVAQFRRVPNLFEILGYDYWHLNYGYDLPADVRRRRDAYLATEAGKAHVLAVASNKVRAAGGDPADLTDAQILEHASGFFGGGHDVVIARRHFVDGASDSAQLASSGTLTPEEHAQFIGFTAQAARAKYELIPDAKYVVVFQNWLKPAGASFDHLHKQVVAIDEMGAQQEAAQARARANPDVFNEVAADFAIERGLLIAHNEHAIAFAGFGHRYPTIEIYSRASSGIPWEQNADELRGMSDLLHAMHAATGADVACNEEWHYQPPESPVAAPWRVMLKWRVSTLAGFEGATKIYLNTIAPDTMRSRVVERLTQLRLAGVISADLAIAEEADLRPHPLRYHR